MSIQSILSSLTATQNNNNQETVMNPIVSLISQFIGTQGIDMNQVSTVISQFTHVQVRQTETVDLEIVRELIKLVKTLNSFELAHTLISDFHLDTVDQVEKTIDCLEDTLTDEQVGILYNMMKTVTDEMESELKQTLIGRLSSLGLPRLLQASGLGRLLGC